MVFRSRVHFGIRKCKWFRGGGAGALREPIDSNSSLPVIPTFSMFLAALEILRHMLDFKSSMSCLGLGLRLGDLNDHSCYKFRELFGSKLKCL